MSNRAVAIICTAASLQTVNDIWQFVIFDGQTSGWGPGNISIPLSADGQEPATHYGAYAASTPEELAAQWQRLTDGDLPAENGFVYGEEGCPSEQDAIDACGSGNLVLSVIAGGGSSIEHWNGFTSGLGLQRIVVEP